MKPSPQIAQAVSAIMRHRLWSIESLDHIACAVRALALGDADADPHGGLALWGSRDPDLRVVEGIALIDIKGILTKGWSWWGGSSMAEIRRQVVEAIEDASVKGIFFDIDSPGGTVAGTQELGDLLLEAREIKPLHAQIGDQACSAAYWLASSCDTVVANKTALTGSVGVIRVIEDFSGWFAEMGVEVHPIRSGPLKGGNQFGEPLSPRQREAAQGVVDRIAGTFFSHVERTRGFSEEQINAISSGASFVAEEALALGLIDEVGNRADVLAAFGQSATGTGMNIFRNRHARGARAQDDAPQEEPKKKPEDQPADEGSEGGSPGPTLEDLAALITQQNAALEDSRAANATLKAELDALKASQTQAKFQAEAQSYPAVPSIKTDDLAALIRETEESLGAVRAGQLRAVLGSAARKVETELLGEHGSRAQPADDGAVVKAAADAYQRAEPGLSRAQAVAKAYEHNPVAYSATLRPASPAGEAK